ncbi:MAG: MFS transporter [Candidatus Bathyarchaeota archaeon]|nr:MFS transporter [Candidatus Bathyarchaeota archaeon]
MSQEKNCQPDSTEVNLRPLYVRSVVNSLGMGMVNPFMSAYAVELGASSSEMGWFQSLTNLSNNVMQVFWGKLSDRLGKRISFIVLGGLIISALWIPMMFVTNASQLIILIAIQALLGSMATPAWTALIGDLVPSLRLGRASAAINLWASVGSLIATLVSGIIMVSVGETLQEMFFIPFTVAVICGFISSFVMLSAKEKRNNKNSASKRGFLPEMFEIVTRVRKSPDFMRYSLAGAFFTFFMSISWPLFSITLIRVLDASMLEIALLSVTQMTITIIFQSRIGRLADTLGRKPLLVLFRFSLVTVPIAYAFAPNVYVLIGVSAFWGISMALGQASMTAYMLDVTPEAYRGSFTAFYNLIMGVTSFFGSLVGGYSSDYTIGLFGLTLGLQIVYMISMVGRGIGAATYLTLRETLKRS